MAVPGIWARAFSISIRLILLSAVALGTLLPWFRPAPSVIAKTKPHGNPNPSALSSSALSSPDGYVGSAACADCHDDVYQTFTRTDMGRSMALVTPELIRTLSLPGSTYSAALNRHFDVSTANGKLYQSEWQTGPDGGDVFRNIHPTGWIIGSGINGFGALLARGDYLFEAPLSFYTTTKQWRLSPGYETTDLAFNRPIHAECIYCHSGRPKPVEAFTGKFDATPFSQLAIGCENCHGPGAAHIRTMRKPSDKLQDPHIDDLHRDLHIVNPSSLKPELQNDICMGCHQGGDVRVPRPGKTYRDFRPGTPLDDTLSIFVTPMTPDRPKDSDHVNHYFEMSMSKCFRASAGQMSCTTCHDPHIEPTHEEAPAYFNQRCMGCHTVRSCTLPLPERQATAPADNCIGCHMPRREVTEIAHDSLSNHRILARPDEPWPDVAYQQTTPSLPDLVHINRVPGRDLPALSLLEAYKEISVREPEYRAAYLKTLAALEQSDPNHAEVQLQLGLQDLKNRDAQKALAHLRRSIELDPQVALAYLYLSEALAETGQIDDSIAANEKAVSLEPYNETLQRALVRRLITAKQYKQAQAAAEHYLEVFPEDPAIRDILAKIKSLQ